MKCVQEYTGEEMRKKKKQMMHFLILKEEGKKCGASCVFFEVFVESKTQVENVGLSLAFSVSVANEKCGVLSRFGPHFVGTL